MSLKMRIKEVQRNEAQIQAIQNMNMAYLSFDHQTLGTRCIWRSAYRMHEWDDAHNELVLTACIRPHVE